MNPLNRPLLPSEIAKEKATRNFVVQEVGRENATITVVVKGDVSGNEDFVNEIGNEISRQNGDTTLNPGPG